MKKRDLIITDCDGVLLDWLNGFNEWMDSKGYVRLENYDTTAYGLHIHYGLDEKLCKKLISDFNESAAIGFLKTCKNADAVLPLLFDEGFDIVVLSSLSDNVYSQKARRYNLEEHFGEIFNEIICLVVGADKDDALAKLNEKYLDRYENIWWVEDKFENAIAGHKLGFKTILVEHDYNLKNDLPEGMYNVKCWAEIENILY